MSITGYYINSDIINTTTNNTSIVLSTIDPDLCLLNYISIAAINEVGDGQTNIISFYYQRGKCCMSINVIAIVLLDIMNCDC